MKKYRIQEFLDRLPRGEYGKAIEELCSRLEVNRSQFWRIRNINMGDASAANSDQLLIIADFFGCKIDDLLNKG